MPRADFYLIAKPRFREQPLLLACELARKAVHAGQPLLVLAASREQAEALDDLLWSFDPDEYLPHQIAGEDEGEDEVEVLIAPPDATPPLRALVLNLRDEPVPPGFERVLEVVPADPAARGRSRDRWRAYQSRGLAPAKHDM